MLSILFIILGFGVIFIYIYTHRVRNREDLSVYDQRSEPLFSTAPASSTHNMMAAIFNRPIPFKFRLSQKNIIRTLRQKLDEMGTRVEISSAIISVETDNISGELMSKIQAPRSPTVPSKVLQYSPSPGA
ncbi:MAG: hypothetical protein GY808_13725 [Gammaproteobacteria bacterium]|nr:hypothetical protein [Gammaproteobacteria bacterium]